MRVRARCDQGTDVSLYVAPHHAAVVRIHDDSPVWRMFLGAAHELLYVCPECFAVHGFPIVTRDHVDTLCSQLGKVIDLTTADEELPL